MNSALVALVSGTSIFVGTLIGIGLRKLLPEDHLSSDSRDAVKVGAGMISMMSALVLGLLVSSAKERFDSANTAIVEGGARVIMLDRTLAAYGPETRELREQLRQGVAASIPMLWPEERKGDFLKTFEKGPVMEKLLPGIGALKPQTDFQRELQQEAFKHCNEVLMSRWTQIEQEQNGLPLPFIVVLLFWLTMLYMGFGLLAPHNLTVITAMFVAALAVATAMFLILEMNRPMDGSIRISSAPMLKALEHLGR